MWLYIWMTSSPSGQQKPYMLGCVARSHNPNSPARACRCLLRTLQLVLMIFVCASFLHVNYTRTGIIGKDFACVLLHSCTMQTHVRAHTHTYKQMAWALKQYWMLNHLPHPCLCRLQPWVVWLWHLVWLVQLMLSRLRYPILNAVSKYHNLHYACRYELRYMMELMGITIFTMRRHALKLARHNNKRGSRECFTFGISTFLISRLVL